MIKTYKIKHNQNLKTEINKAIKIANFAINNPDKLSSKHVSKYGLKSAISNQILRKYGRNKKIKKVHPEKVKLTIPGQSLEIKDKQLRIIPLKFRLNLQHLPEFSKVNQVELDNEFAFISVEVKEEQKYKPQSYIGVDLNATGFLAVTADMNTGKVQKLGKKAEHTRKKYKTIRTKLQKKGKYKSVKNIKNRESRIVRDLNHKISHDLVVQAKNSQSAIVFEDLKNIKKNTRREVKRLSKNNRGTVSSWSFYQFQQFVEYKARQHGVPVLFINPHNTSKVCARCGGIGERDKKAFKCPHCGHVEHADVNAAFNIASLGKSVFDSRKNGFSGRGVLANPERLLQKSVKTLEPQGL